MGKRCHPERSISGVEGSSHHKRAKSSRWQKKLPICAEILPLRIHTFDQMVFLRPCPSLELFLPGNGTVGIRCIFVINQLVNIIFAGETKNKMVAMLIEPLWKVAGYTDIQNGIVPVG